MPPPPPTTPGVPGLPTTITYTQVVQAAALLAPDLALHRIRHIAIDPTNVTITVLEDGHEATHTYPTTHPQGSATEGGES